MRFQIAQKADAIGAYFSGGVAYEETRGLFPELDWDSANPESAPDDEAVQMKRPFYQCN